MNERTYQRRLSALGRLSHDARMLQMVEVGMRVRDDRTNEEMVRRMEGGETYERLLALQTCFGSRDGAHVLRALGDPSQLVRKRAARLVALACDDAAALAALQQSSAPARRRILSRLLKQRRQDVIDTFLNTITAAPGTDFAKLVPFGSASLVRSRVAELIDAANRDELIRIARHQPALIAEELVRRADQSEADDPRLVWQVNTALRALPGRSPAGNAAATHLLQAVARFVPLTRLDLTAVAAHDPSVVADLALTSSEPVHESLDRAVPRLGLERVLALLRHQPAMVQNVSRWFSRLTPADREALYHAHRDGWCDSSGAFPPWLIGELATPSRIAEARRNLALPQLAADPNVRLRYAEFLPWEEALAVLSSSLRHPDPAFRQMALGTLVRSVRYQRSRAAELLAMIHARRNEQDPVRQAALSTLADLPPSLWKLEHLPALAEVARDALDAADLSPGSASCLERLFVKLVPFHPGWAADWLATLVKERGVAQFWDLGERLTEAQLRLVAPTLLPVLHSWETRERAAQIVAAAQSLGQRLRALPELVEMLERIVAEIRPPLAAEAALLVLHSHARERFAALVPALLRQDKSWATRTLVFRHLHRRRQDLLTPFLGRRAYRGLFATGRTRFVLWVGGGFFRWTPYQQETFAATLGDVIADEERDSPAVLRAIGQLGELGFVPPTLLHALAGPEGTRPAARDAALRALGRRDNGDGLPFLLEALADDRARVVIYVLRRAFLNMPNERALPLLRNVPVVKVTVAKEVARLLGDMHSEEAFQELLTWSKRDLHRDVRVAVLRGLWEHLERDEAWEAFEAAARSDDAAVAAMVGRIPVDRASSRVARRLAALLALLLSHADPKVRLDALRRCATLPVNDEARALLRPLLACMESAVPEESAAASQAVFATYAGRQADLVRGAISRILPNRRALEAAVNALTSAVRSDRRRLLPTADAALDALATDPLTSRQQVQLLVASRSGVELAAALEPLAGNGALHMEALWAAIEALGGRHGGADYIRELEQAEVALARSPDERLRRLALAALVAQCRWPWGWNEERLGRLRAYRTDPAPLVVAAAQFTLPAAELEQALPS